MPKKFSIELSDELAGKITAESERRQVPLVEVFRLGMEDFFQRDRQRQKFEVLLSEIRDTGFETVKTRAVLLRCFDIVGQTVGDQLLEAATKDAEAYLEERRKG